MDFSDRTIVLGAAVAFFFFLIVHVALFRYAMPKHAKPKRLSPVLITSYIGGSLADGIFSVGVPLAHPAQAESYTLPVFFFGALVSLALYSLLVLLYMSWIFGMGEAALRIRLLVELERNPGGSSSLEEIYRSYNAEGIVNARLARLIGTGHLQIEQGAYRMGHRVLLIQLWIVDLLKRLIGLQRIKP